MRKKPPLGLRRPASVVDLHQAERFVRGLTSDPPPVPAPPPAPPPLVTKNVQTSRRPDAPTPDLPDAPEGAAASKSLVYRKRTDDVRRRMTVYLPEDLSRRLRLYAAEKDQDYSVVLAEALTALLDRKGVR
jgi:hypothetical protein